ncbi:MAG: alpha/beta fold hydrolase [Ilumatobacteraceae bacterium]
MATLTVGDQVVWYGTEGDPQASSAPVLLLPGTTMNRTGWDMVRAALPADAGLRFVLVELPGSGESAMPAGPLTVEGLADQAAAVMAHLGHERYHVAGYSLGAVAALGVAARDAEHVITATSLCGWALTDARMRFTFDLWKRLIAISPELFMRYAVADGFTAGAIAALEPMLEDVISMGAATIAPGSAAQLDLDSVVDISAMLESITAPTLIIGAEQDRWVDVSHSHDLASKISGARLELLPAGHVVIQELPGDVARLLHEHVSSK